MKKFIILLISLFFINCNTTKYTIEQTVNSNNNFNSRNTIYIINTYVKIYDMPFYSKTRICYYDEFEIISQSEYKKAEKIYNKVK